MTIDAISGTTTSSTSDTAAGGALKGTKDEFLKLFMAQLQHQDPFQPKDNSDMVAQLAQLSSVEQATQTNQYLSDLASAQAATSSAGLASLVGRDCQAASGDFQLDRVGAAPPLQVTSTSAMSGAAIVVTDASGKEVRRLPIAAGSTTAQVAWDGKDGNGLPAAAGSYHITIDPGRTTGTITSQWHGRVDAVELTGNGTRLRMGGVLLTPADIRTIGTIGNAGTSGPPTTAPV